jgi:hypothetical protein
LIHARKNISASIILFCLQFIFCIYYLQYHRFRSKKKYFHCPLQLKNTLPDPVPGPKLMSMPLDLQSYVDFKTTSLDTEYKWKYHCERTMGVHVELVDYDSQTVNASRRAPLHADDERLLKWETLGVAAMANGLRKERAFFRKTVFQSNDLSRSRKQVKKKTKENRNINVESAEINKLNDAEEILSHAQKSFEVIKVHDLQQQQSSEPLKHKTKPHLTMEWSIPVFPDELLWSNQYRYVGFDDDLAGSNTVKRRKLAEAMVVNAKNEYNARAQADILTGSLIVPKDLSSASTSRPYEYQKQYSMQLEKAQGGMEDTQYLLLIDEQERKVSYKDLAPQKVSILYISFILIYVYSPPQSRHVSNICKNNI